MKWTSFWLIRLESFCFFSSCPAAGVLYIKDQNSYFFFIPLSLFSSIKDKYINTFWLIRARCPSPLFLWKCIFLLLLLVRVLYILYILKKPFVLSRLYTAEDCLSDNLAISQVVLPLFYTFSLVSGRIERRRKEEREKEEKKYIAAPLESSGGVVFT